MKYFDTHLHFPSVDLAGLDRLRRHVDSQPDMVGGLLVLNTPAEVDFAYAATCGATAAVGVCALLLRRC